MNNIFAVRLGRDQRKCAAKGFLRPFRDDGCHNYFDGVGESLQRQPHCALSQRDMFAVDLDFLAGDGGAANSGGTGDADDFSIAGKADSTQRSVGGEIPRLLAGDGDHAGGLLRLLRFGGDVEGT